MRAIILIFAVGIGAAPCEGADSGLAAEAEGKLFNAQYESAAEAYARLVKEDPANAVAHDRLVRALLAAHANDRAYAAVEEAGRAAAGTAPVFTAEGRVAFRKGRIGEAEKLFRQAIVADPKYSDALVGLAGIYSAVSRYKAAQNILRTAMHLNPLDPEAMAFEANEVEGAEHEAELKKLLASLDPASKMARGLRAHIARDAAMHGRKRKLVSKPEATRIKLSLLSDGPHKLMGLGVRIELNDKTTVQLRLDTGAGGISLSPQAAKRAGLEILGDVSTEAHGIGDAVPSESFTYLARRLKIGTLEWENYPVSVYRGARMPDTDGLIGTDVFSRFLVGIDFPAATLSLDPREPEGGSDDPARPDGFSRVFVFGHLLLIPTSINGGPFRLFLLDSGASLNLVDIHAAAESSKVRRQDYLKLRGIQGEVKDVRSADKGTIVFAGFRQENPGLTAMDLHGLSDNAGTEVSGILGMTVLWHLKMSIDYASGSVKLERSARDMQ